MSTKAKIGYGISLGYCVSSGGSFTPIAEILDITPPTLTFEETKIQRSDASVPITEKIPGWGENSDPEVTATYITATKTALYALAGVPYFFKITWPLTGTQSSAGDTVSFAGFISSFGDETPIKDAMKCKIKFAVSGPATFAAGS